MNQILVTNEEDIENKKNNFQEISKQYKINKYNTSYSNSYGMYNNITIKNSSKYMISMIIVFFICILFSYCIYAYGVIAKTDDSKNTENKNETPEVIEELPKPEYIKCNNLFEINDKQFTSKSGDNYTYVAILYIPSLDIRYPVLSKNSDELMEISLSKYWGAEPNEEGNCVIVGHNYRNLTHFGKLPRIKVGDEVELTDSKGKTVTYIVYDRYNVDPTDVACTSQLTDGKTEMTLITCTNGGATRLIVKCIAIEK